MQRFLSEVLYKVRLFKDGSKIKVAAIYSASAVMAAVSLFACNNNRDNPVITTHNPQPGTSPVCPSMMVTIPIEKGSVGKGAAAFGANPMVIPQGAMVSWSNQDEYPHSATANSGEWDTGAIMPGEASPPMQFMTVGSMPYQCLIHGAESMSGTLDVTPLPSGCPMPTPTASAAPSGETEPGVTPQPTAMPAGMPGF